MGEPRTEIAPDLVIEVLSLSDSVSVWRDKLHDYHQIGVREVWAVDLQNEEIEVLAWEEWGYRTVGWFRGETPLTSQALPGLQIVPQALFAQGAAASQTE
jgi:Uma2 family endonuclease